MQSSPALLAGQRALPQKDHLRGGPCPHDHQLRVSARISKAAVPKYSLAVSFKAHGSIQTAWGSCIFILFLNHIAWNPWFWRPGGNEDSLQQDGSIHQETRRKFLSLLLQSVQFPARGTQPAGALQRNGTHLAWEQRQRQRLLQRTAEEHQVSIQSSPSGACCTKPELAFQCVFFPFLTIKANMKTLISPLEPTSPEISVLWQTLGALVHLYGFKAVNEVSWLSRLRKPSHKGFFNPFY